MTARTLAALTALLIVLSPALALAGRPLQTEDTGTVDPGDVELSTATEYVKTPDHQTGLGVLSVTVGLAPGLDGKVDVSGFVVDREGRTGTGGFAEAAIGVKYRLVDETEQRPAVLTALTFGGRPRATQEDLEGIEPAEDGFDLDARLAVSKALGPFTVTWNGGYGFTTDGTTVHALLLGLAGEYRATKALALVAETFSEVTFEGEDPSAVLRAGAIYAITDRIRLDGAVGVGLTRNSPDVTATLGVTFRF
jgi:hypothetical protein